MSIIGKVLARVLLFVIITSMELKALQDLMGHADAHVTLNVYNHKNAERTEKEVQRIDNVINF